MLDYIRYKQLNWYIHVRRMNEEMLPRKMLRWCPHGKKRRPRNSWMQEITTGVRRKGINSMEWIEGKEWRRKNKIETSLGWETIIEGGWTASWPTA